MLSCGVIFNFEAAAGVSYYNFATFYNTLLYSKTRRCPSTSASAAIRSSKRRPTWPTHVLSGRMGNNNRSCRRDYNRDGRDNHRPSPFQLSSSTRSQSCQETSFCGLYGSLIASFLRLPNFRPRSSSRRTTLKLSLLTSSAYQMSDDYRSYGYHLCFLPKTYIRQQTRVTSCQLSIRSSLACISSSNLAAICSQAVFPAALEQSLVISSEVSFAASLS